MAYVYMFISVGSLVSLHAISGFPNSIGRVLDGRLEYNGNPPSELNWSQGK